jgi:hypothetical protein
MKFLAALVLFGTSIAANAATEVSSANINAGNWIVSGNATLQSSSITENNEFSMSVLGELFVLDRLAVGPSFAFESWGGNRSASLLGPSATYFFWNDGAAAAYVNANYLFGLTALTVEGVLGARVGFSYFVAPTVSIGPAVFFNGYVRDPGNDYSRYGVALNLGIFL